MSISAFLGSPWPAFWTPRHKIDPETFIKKVCGRDAAVELIRTYYQRVLKIVSGSIRNYATIAKSVSNGMREGGEAYIKWFEILKVGMDISHALPGLPFSLIGQLFILNQFTYLSVPF
jgi:hypothetical protein